MQLRERTPEEVLQTMANRWQRAATLSYRSEAVVDHKGEFRVHIRSLVQLRRPNSMRLIFIGDRPEATRVRVCGGGFIFDRPGGRNEKTVRTPLRRKGTEDIAHPLDELAWAVEQFLRRDGLPFSPTAAWGDRGERRTSDASLLRDYKTASGEKRDVYKVTFQQGTASDVLHVDAQNYAPLLLVRIGQHAGMVQELLRETFSDVQLYPVFSPDIFQWTADDESGRSVSLR